MASANPKEEPKIIQPDSNIADGFKELVKLYLHGIGAGLGFSYVLLTRDLENVNFASTQFNAIADNRHFQILLKWFSHNVCRHMYQEFVKMEFISGKMPGNFGAAQYMRDPWKYSQCYWLPLQGRDWVDPKKMADAMSQEYKTGYVTFEELCAFKGKNWRAVAKQRKSEKEFFKELGIDELLPEDAENWEKVAKGEEESEAEREYRRAQG